MHPFWLDKMILVPSQLTNESVNRLDRAPLRGRKALFLQYHKHGVV